MQTGRPARVGALIHEEVARLITKGLKDPRIGFVSVMSVRMSTDLHYANIHVSLFGDEKERKSSLIALRNSAGWIRREVGKHLRMRVTPEIRFFEDDSLDKVYQLESVLDAIHQEQAEAPMLNLGLAELVEELRGVNSFLVTSHVSPDGDAVGGLLGIAHLLRAMGKTVTCALDDPIPSIYRGLPGASTIINAQADCPVFEAMVIVDVASLARIGEIRAWLEPGQRVFVVDHHLADEPDGTAGFIDPSYAAVGEIVVDLFEAAGIPLSVEAAHCAYVAQITDTGGYRYANTNTRSHLLAAKLHETGLETASICETVFTGMTRAKFDMLCHVLARATFRAEGAIASSYVSFDDLAAVGGEKEDTNGLINYLRNVDGVSVGVLFTQVDQGTTKVSFRSDERVNSAVFLAQFGGGGHAAAAGATMEVSLADAMPMVLDRLEKALRESS